MNCFPLRLPFIRSHLFGRHTVLSTRGLRHRGLLALLCFGAGMLHADDPTVWSWLADFRFNEALVRAEAAGKQSPSDRTSQLGVALALLQAQPRSEEKIERSARMLERIFAATPEDDLGVIARYYRARIDQTHRTIPRPLEAARAYRELLTTGATPHSFREQAALKLCLLLLYVPGVAPNRTEGFTEAESLRAHLFSPAAWRDHHVILARAYLFYSVDPPKALDHLLAAENFPYALPAQRADNLVTLHQLAEEQSRPDIASAAAHKFLELNRRDSRTQIIEERRRKSTTPEAGILP